MSWLNQRKQPGAARRVRRPDRDQPIDRSILEAAGWRTTLEYRENHVRDHDGMLGAVEIEWRAEAERAGDDGVEVMAARGPNPSAVWRRLRASIEDHERRRIRWVRQRVLVR